MSLFGQTARYLLLTALLIALVGSVGFYTLIHRKIRHEVDEILVSQVEQTHYRLLHHPYRLRADENDNPHLERISRSVPAAFDDKLLLDSLTNKPIEVRQFQTTISAQGIRYLVRVQQPYYEFNELARDLSVGVIVGFLVLMALSLLIGLNLSARLWQPFYATVDQLDRFRLDQPAPAFPAARINEFALLSRALTELTRKLHRQFSLQKQFIENASHELQTPLAVASAELDFLLQSPHLTQTDHTHLQRSMDALSRLSQLNRSLLLLTQVDNEQFVNNERLNLSNLLINNLLDFEPFWVHKQVTCRTTVHPDVYLRMDRQLAGVLLTNLLKNAVRHCPVGGQIDVTLTGSQLTIANSGDPLPFAENQLFGRFVRNPARPDSVGLGLALVKQICDRYALSIGYHYDSVSREHTFCIEITGREG